VGPGAARLARIARRRPVQTTRLIAAATTQRVAQHARVVLPAHRP
jgi:hypothetical protein